ncbi:dsDNA nuclease domain-containing protein [Flagellimonas algicola]|uniref:DUF4297 domain-containing protein n=1 Tax=Flagellimonas algicola TaxID=2583815 RepID=A0ABY2WR72_9FLAO|nr:dsDNA nuclease domain-containing protein [Allomuricauda algicola]TMU57443.1 DUF4297 domain-containing protein [Allomuricauda algicola]
MISNPDSILDTNDPGDDVLSRFSYQIYYSVLVSLSILDSERTTKEIYCEQFEDILAKEKDGRFLGIQVKTRALQLGPFKTTDAAVIKSLTRFVELDLKFPSKFRKFILVSNTAFAPNNKSLNVCIKFAKGNNQTELLKPRSSSNSLINKVAIKLKCDKSAVIDTLKKVELQSEYADIKNLHLFVQDKLKKSGVVPNLNPGVIESVVEKLFSFHFKASSLQGVSNGLDCYISKGTSEEEKIKEVLEAKRITKKDLETVIKSEIENPVTLYLKDSPQISGISNSDELMTVKMDAGRISSENIDLSRDYKYSMTNHLLSLMYKEGPEIADKKYNQIKLIVNTECQEAFDEFEDKNLVFGQQMLKNIRSRLRLISKKDQESVFNARYEHLLGMVGILTEECKVWWSKKFEIND